MPAGMATKLKRDLPEIVRTTRVEDDFYSEVHYGDRRFAERIRFVDPSFLEMFSFPLLQGASSTALKDGHAVVITEEMARKYFAGESPMGKVLSIRNNRWDGELKDFTVTGI